FGGSIRKTFETSRDRRAAADRIVQEQGVSPAEARAMAKQQVPRDFTEVRKAKAQQAAGEAAQDLVENRQGSVGIVMARVEGMQLIARELRKVGMDDEATQMSLAATEIKNEEFARIAGVEKVRQLTATSAAKEKQTQAETARIGLPDIDKLLGYEENLIALLDTNDNPEERVTLNRYLDITQQSIAKKVFITRTQADVDLASNLRPTVAGKLQESILESNNQLGLLASIGDTYKPEYLTYFAKGKKAVLAGAEKFGVTLPESQQKFVAEYTVFTQNALDSLNLYIKFITGAQMSNVEADRLRKGFPDAENNSATEFIARYEGTVRKMLGYTQRASEALRTGNTGLLPKDADSLGADITSYLPTDEFVRKFLGLDKEELAPRDSDTEFKAVLDIVDAEIKRREAAGEK
ncbi:hypothetical protein LCGC14_1159110, partial [marine sediment metagenome]